MTIAFNVHKFLRKRISKSAPFWLKTFPSNTKTSFHWPFYNYLSSITCTLLLIKNNKKTFSIKMKENVGMSKPKKHANNVGRLTYDRKLNKPLPYNLTYTPL